MHDPIEVGLRDIDVPKALRKLQLTEQIMDGTGQVLGIQRFCYPDDSVPREGRVVGCNVGKDDGMRLTVREAETSAERVG